MDAIGIARSGLQASMARMNASASTIANAAATSRTAPGGDVTDALVDQLSAKRNAEANIKVITAASDLEKRSIELWG